MRLFLRETEQILANRCIAFVFRFVSPTNTQVDQNLFKCYAFNLLEFTEFYDVKDIR